MVETTNTIWQVLALDFYLEKNCLSLYYLEGVVQLNGYSTQLHTILRKVVLVSGIADTVDENETRSKQAPEPHG